jgi:hypothetical protein
MAFTKLMEDLKIKIAFIETLLKVCEGKVKLLIKN